MTRERTSSGVGRIDLGDTATPALSTMRQPERQVQASMHRQRQLRRNRRESISGPLRYWVVYREAAYRNTWLNSLLMMLAVLGLYTLSGDYTPRNPLHKFIFLSYKIDSPDGVSPPLYGKGPADFAFVAFYMLFFTFFREFCMQKLIAPVAKHFGITKRGKVSRFMEQSYSMIYYGLSGPFGLYIMYHTPIWYFNTTAFYEEYPHKTHIAMFKAFYLLQAAFWAQQSVILTLQLEKPRKDFKELVFHHIVTMALIFLSYRFHFTWIGLAVYITMDVSDFFLALSKTLNYIDSVATPHAFMFFMAVWIYLRHYLNLKFLYSIATEFETVGDFTLNWETQQYKCRLAQYITFGLIAALQLVNVYWLVLIIRIAYRYVFQNIQKDERSEDEDEEEEEENARNEANDHKNK